MTRYTTTKCHCGYYSVSEAPKAAPPKKYQSYNPNYKTDEEKKEEVSTSVFSANVSHDREDG